MTILYILISTDPFGGATKSFLTLLDGILKAGNKAIVVVPNMGGIYQTLKDMGAEVVVQYSKDNTWTGARNFKQRILYIPRQLGRLVINFIACRELSKKLKNKHIDIVHSNNSVASLGTYIANAFHIPHVYHIREYGDKDFGLTFFPTNKHFYKHLKDTNIYTICITKDIQKHFNLSNDSSSRVIYNGVINDECFLPLENELRTNLLYAGRIEPTKGLMELIEAYERYSTFVSQPLPLEIAGEITDHNYYEKVASFIQCHQLSTHIRFLGLVNNMQDIYAKAKAVVVPSHFEGFGRCMPEAISFGCIIIGRDTGGTKEQFDNGLYLCHEDIGLRFHNQEELVEALLKVHEMSISEVAHITQKAQNCVRQLYTKSAYVKAVLNFYEEIKEKQR